MVHEEIIRELEDLLFDKLKRQEKCLNYYELIDDSVRQELLIRTFERIEDELQEIQKIDLLFLSKFDKLKQSYAIKSLDELPIQERKAFEMIQNAVVLASKRFDDLEAYKMSTKAQKTNVQKEFLIENRKASAMSAYKNINK